MTITNNKVGPLMTTNKDQKLHDKFNDLNEQMDILTEILDVMSEKMLYIENATAQIRAEIQNELNDLNDEEPVDNRKT